MQDLDRETRQRGERLGVALALDVGGRPFAVDLREAAAREFPQSRGHVRAERALRCAPREQLQAVERADDFHGRPPQMLAQKRFDDASADEVERQPRDRAQHRRGGGRIGLTAHVRFEEAARHFAERVRIPRRHGRRAERRFARQTVKRQAHRFRRRGAHARIVVTNGFVRVGRDELGDVHATEPPERHHGLTTQARILAGGRLKNERCEELVTGDLGMLVGVFHAELAFCDERTEAAGVGGQGRRAHTRARRLWRAGRQGQQHAAGSDHEDRRDGDRGAALMSYEPHVSYEEW